MKAKIKYTDESIQAKVIEDFLPPSFREEYLVLQVRGGEASHAASTDDSGTH